MARELFARTRKKVISFDQNGEFYHRKARKHMDNSNYLNALNLYRKAVEKEPQNVEYLLDLAEVFTEMGCYDQSSRVLFTILQKEKARFDCYFGLGCNFLGMQDYDKAIECFEKYLDIDPYGIYSEEARDLLEVLEDYEYYFDENPDGFDSGESNIYTLATEGKDLLDQGEYKEAIKKLEKVICLDPDLLFVKNNLALAYFCAGRLNQAIDLSLDVIEREPQNIHANCNLCLFINERDGAKAGEKYLDAIIDFKTQDPEEIHKIAVTLCELKEHERANLVLKRLLQYKPYDIRILHYVAVSCFNLGKYREAYKYWRKIDRIDPDNTVSDFYLKLVQEYLNGDKTGGEISYHFQVPYDEILLRIKKLNSILKLDEKSLLIKWRYDDSFRMLLYWGLELNDKLIKKAILNVVASFNDRKAEEFLREFLLRISESEELKTEALGLLKQMSAQEPYMAYVDDGLVEVKVDILEEDAFIIPSDMEVVIQTAVNMMEGRYEEGYQDDVRQIWTKFLKSLYPNELPRIKKYEAWAAAIELYYCMEHGIYVKNKDVSDHYGISYSSLYNNYNRIRMILQEK